MSKAKALSFKVKVTLDVSNNEPAAEDLSKLIQQAFRGSIPLFGHTDSWEKTMKWMIKDNEAANVAGKVVSCTQVALSPASFITTGLVKSGVKKAEPLDPKDINLLMAYLPPLESTDTKGKGTLQAVNKSMCIRVCLLRMQFSDDIVAVSWRRKFGKKHPVNIRLEDVKQAFVGKEGPNEIQNQDGKKVECKEGATVKIWWDRINQFRLDYDDFSEYATDLTALFADIKSYLNLRK